LPVLVLRLLEFQTAVNDRPDHCPFCGCALFQRWGSGNRTLQDTNIEELAFYRYRCNACGRTFRYQASEELNLRVSQRIHKLAAVTWALGLSARDVERVFLQLGIEISHMTVWRDGTQLISKFHDPNHLERPDRYYIDPLFQKKVKQELGTTIILNLAEGKTAVLGKIGQVYPREVLNWLNPLIADLDMQVSLFGTDYLHNLETIKGE